MPSAESRLLSRLVSAGEAGLERSGGQAETGLERRGLAFGPVGGRFVATAAGRARIAREAAGPEGFLAQHRTVERRVMATETGHEDLLVDLDESPLAWLARRKGRDGRPLLAPAEVAAGERLRADFTRAQMGPRVTANWEAAVSSGRRGGPSAGLDLSEGALAAKERVMRALDAVGPELSGALLDVCCFLKGLEEVERDRGWPARGAKLVLGLALARLARHYGLTVEGTGPGRIVGWGAPDSRPTIDGAS
ncbi:MAG: hypothetical protein DI565_06360 [Ancylobacter novellus]|uniref:DUF6456 domain-containing protein n=1 Tax=Ancylobacter novellus TaxID=921 RepID=A0A2W5KIT2_ANCNO|nr:MAG: hypothetical protein DI565_06360 [Ancylobacter novellus]